MSIACQCPSCGRRVNAPDQYAGKSAKCPQCAQPFIVGAASPIMAGAPAGRGQAPAFQFNAAPTYSPNGTVPAGGGSKKKLLVIGGIAAAACLFVVVLLCGGAALYFMSGGAVSGWKEYAPSGAGFTVLMPGAPVQKDKNDPKIVSATPIHEALTQPAGSKFSFSVEYYDLNGKPINQYLYLSWMKHYLLSGGGQLAREKDISLSPYGGREIVVRMPDNKVVVRRVYLAEARVFWVTAQYPDTPVPPAEIEKFLDSFKITSVAKAPEEPVAVADAPEPPKKKDRSAPKKKDTDTSPPPKTPDAPPKNTDPPKVPDKAPAANLTADENAVVQAINRFRGEKKVQLLAVGDKLMEAARDSARATAEKKNALINNELGYPHIIRVGPITLNGGTAAAMARIIEEQAKRIPAFGNNLANPKSQGIGVGFATTPGGAIICMLFIGGD